MNPPASRPSASACSAWTSCITASARWITCARRWRRFSNPANSWMLLLVRLAHRHDFFHFQPGQAMDGPPQVEQDAHHHDHRGNGDHRVADQGHATQLGIECLSAGRADHYPLGNDVVHDRGKEEGPGQEIGSLEQALFEYFMQPALLQTF